MMRGWRVRVFVLCLVAVSLVGCGSSTNPPPATISGRVTEGSRQIGSALSGVTVACAGVSATTDANGDYVLADVPAGTYPLTATLVGYEPRIVSVALAGEPVTRDLTLYPLVVEFRETERHPVDLDGLGGSMVMSPDGDIYTADDTTIYRLDRQGVVQASWPAEGLTPTYYGSLALDSDGMLYVLARTTDAAGAVLKYDRDGNLQGRVDLADVGLGGLALGPDGKLWVCGDNGPISYTATGVADVHWDLPADESMPDDGLAVGPDGVVYVLSQYDAGDHYEYYVDKFSATGEDLGYFGVVYSDGGMLLHNGVLYPEEDELPVIYRYQLDGTPLPAIVLPTELALDGHTFGLTPAGDIVALTWDADGQAFLVNISNRVTSRGTLLDLLDGRAVTSRGHRPRW